jgi:hypothetical protein
LNTLICPQCCAEGRLKTIACPQDCRHLQSELYQHKRRKERALSRGKDFVESNTKLFTSQESRDFAFNLQADVYYHHRQHGPVDDDVIVEILECVRSSQSKVFLPQAAQHPLTRFLLERLQDANRYPALPAFGTEDKARALRSLVTHVRGLKGTGNRRFHERLAGFFDALDFEADLDYSPGDATTPAESTDQKRSPGGLILPGS